jgi:predicted glutamine amidotransferase
MCRFLLAQSKNLIKPQPLLEEFASMAEKSKALDGDWQGDGWGVAWLDNHNQWQLQKSLLPIWKDTKKFITIPQTTTVVVHARSASFPQHKGILAFNQPYIDGEYAFVFNGLLKGVQLTIPGKIGAEKIWYLVKQQLQSKNPQEALDFVKKLLLKNSKEIVALNMGIATPERIFSVNYFIKHPEYYQMYFHEDEQIKLICSEELDWSVSR